MSGVVGDLVDENANSRTVAPTAVGIQVALMTGISIVTILAFNILRPRNKIVYEPKVKYHVGNKVPPRISDGLFGWFSPLVHTKEPELLDKIGLDAVTFLRFLRMLRWLFTGIAVIACGALIPINVVYNIRNVPDSARDALSILTIRDVSGSILFAHVAATYVFTFLVMFLVWTNWREMVRLRHVWFRSPEYTQSFYARTLLVQKVPKKSQSDEGIQAIFEAVQVPYPTTSVHIGRRVGQLPELIEYHNNAVRELEQVLVRYLKKGRIGKERPTLRLGGFLGMGGRKVDAIDHYTNKLKRAEAAIQDYRQQIDTRKPENYGFASMAAVPYAHIVARLLRNKKPYGAVISLAPNPKDIIWKNLNQSDATVTRKRLTGWLWLGFVCFVNTVPLLAVSILANLASLTAYVGFLNTWAKANHATFSIVSGVLPSAISAFFGFFLPVIMRRLSRYQGAITHSRLDRAVVARYFAFLMISQLFIFTLIGVIFKSVEQIVSLIGQHKSFNEIVQNLNKLPDLIHRTYIDQANYWLTYFPLRGFLVIFDLAQILNLVWIWIKKGLFGRTPRDIREWTQPPDFEYAIYYSNLLFMVAVGLVFAPLAPLVALAAAIVFWLSSFVYKYQLMFVFVSRVESGGRLWNVVVNRLLVTVACMQALMILTIGLQHGFKSLQWLSSVPPIIIIVIFKGYVTRRFSKEFRYYVPSDEELRMAKVHSERADNRGHRLEKRFGHPALHAELFTPLLHANMMPLLPQVYKGRLESDEATLDEYGGKKAEAQVIPGGIKIAAIHQNELEYDPVLYQRDRGELDWDARSLASTAFLGEGSALQPSKEAYAAGRASPAPSRPGAYDAYLAHSAQQDIELSRFDSHTDQLPLLAARQSPTQVGGDGYFGPPSPAGSTPSLPAYQSPRLYPQQYQDAYVPPVPQLPPGVQRAPPSEGFREAPVHRPYPPSRQASAYTDGGGSDGGGNMAGRGTYRRDPSGY